MEVHGELELLCMPIRIREWRGFNKASGSYSGRGHGGRRWGQWRWIGAFMVAMQHARGGAGGGHPDVCGSGGRPAVIDGKRLRTSGHVRG